MIVIMNLVTDILICLKAYHVKILNAAIYYVLLVRIIHHHC